MIRKNTGSLKSGFNYYEVEYGSRRGYRDKVKFYDYENAVAFIVSVIDSADFCVLNAFVQKSVVLTDCM